MAAPCDGNTVGAETSLRLSLNDEQESTAASHATLMREHLTAQQGGSYYVAFIFTSASRWILVLLGVTTIALPFLVRRHGLSLALGLAGATRKPLLQRMRPHYWLGYAILGITLAHATVPMSAGFASRASVLGLYLAIGALFLLCGQVALGLSLRRPDLVGRRRMRRAHFWTMVGIVALGVAHIALNSPAI